LGGTKIFGGNCPPVATGLAVACEIVDTTQ